MISPESQRVRGRDHCLSAGLASCSSCQLVYQARKMHPMSAHTRPASGFSWAGPPSKRQSMAHHSAAPHSHRFVVYQHKRFAGPFMYQCSAAVCDVYLALTERWVSISRMVWDRSHIAEYWMNEWTAAAAIGSGCPPDDGSTWFYRMRRWPNITLILDQFIAFAGRKKKQAKQKRMLTLPCTTWH